MTIHFAIRVLASVFGVALLVGLFVLGVFGDSLMLLVVMLVIFVGVVVVFEFLPEHSDDPTLAHEQLIDCLDERLPAPTGLIRYYNSGDAEDDPVLAIDRRQSADTGQRDTYVVELSQRMRGSAHTVIRHTYTIDAKTNEVRYTTSTYDITAPIDARRVVNSVTVYPHMPTEVVHDVMAFFSK